MMFSRLTIWMIISVCALQPILAQPVLSSRRSMHGHDVYADFKNPSLFYYSPAEIVLNTLPSGAPFFTLLQMRYTGTHLYSDKDAKAFHNILQLGVRLESISQQSFDDIRSGLGRNVTLKPIPVKEFHAELIIPLGDADAANEKYRKINVNGVEGNEASSPGSTFWHERTFTMQLENYEAQLLWDQVETGKLGISFSYAFYAEAMPGMIGEVIASADRKEFAEEMAEATEDETFDQTVSKYLIKAATFPVYINISQWPESLKKVDVNEELPPAYGSFQVRCYDFTDNLRPDLLKKIVEIKAYAAAKEYISIKKDFSASKPDINSLTARFPYAIRLDHPVEYRVIEINKEGEIETMPWIRPNSWHEVIDVTTPATENKIKTRTIDVEIDLENLETDLYENVVFEIQYALNGKTVRQMLTWKQGDLESMKTIKMSYDLDVPVRYRMTWTAAEKEMKTAFKPIDETDQYFFVRPPEE